MAHRIDSVRPVRLQHAFHGYSEGHRLLHSSVELVSRDAKTMLMMSDASGPAAVIGDEGYLTGYPLTESGYYAFARTWPAPEMSRPGCVWTHTILVEFSDIPALGGATGLLKLFRRPRGKDDFDNSEMTLNSDSYPRTSFSLDATRRILWATYANPTKSIISTSFAQHERDEFVLAMWAQQWPRLRRAFRFCTLSFADRSVGGSAFDLQFLPASGRVPRAQFRKAFDADKADFEDYDWLDDAVTDIQLGRDGPLREFLRLAGSDVSGREAFVPLASIHALSRRFTSQPESLDRAIAILGSEIPDSQGHAARALIVRAAASAPHDLGLSGLEYIISNFDLLEGDDSAKLAESVGTALWAKEPRRVLGLLSSDTIRRQIAERTLSVLPRSALLEETITGVPEFRQALLDIRPDLGVEAAYWSLPGTWNSDSIQNMSKHTEFIPAIIAAMIRSGRPLAREACVGFGREKVLRLVVDVLDKDETVPQSYAAAWLAESCSDAGAVARLLCERSISRVSTLELIARAIRPDFVPNDFGEDPWLTAARSMPRISLTKFLASFLLARAFGRRTLSSAELLQLCFDAVYYETEHASLPDDAWLLLDGRLYRSYFWPIWDRCERIRQTTVSLFVDRNIDPRCFINITWRDEVFELLVRAAGYSYSGQQYLKSVREQLIGDASAHERLRAVNRALW